MADADKGAAFLDAQRPKPVDAKSLRASLQRLWEAGMPPGAQTGWPSVDKHYTVADGMVTIITGWPSSGKSEWLDALLVNLARQGWRVSIFSPENQPVELHASKLLEKISGKPFGRGPTERMGPDDIDSAYEDLAEWFQLLEMPEEGSLSVQGVIDATWPQLSDWQAAGHKVGLVMDPWNELEHWRPPGLSETEYISKTLSHLRNWARKHKVHVWLVAHPQKAYRENGKLPIPRPDMISGSQHWWNKADMAVTVCRDMENPESPNVDIHVQKVRFKHLGRVGTVTLRWDKTTGRYHELPNLRDVSAYRRKADGDDE